MKAFIVNSIIGVVLWAVSVTLMYSVFWGLGALIGGFARGFRWGAGL